MFFASFNFLDLRALDRQLYANPVMQKSQAKKGFPYVHAMVFDVGQGLVKELDIDFKAIIRK